MHLCTLPVVLVLARELLAFEAVEDLRDCFGRLGKHRLERDTRRELAVFAEVLDAALH